VHVPDASLPDMVGGGKPDRELPVLIYSRKLRHMCYHITDPDNRTGHITAGSRMYVSGIGRSYTSCNGSFWSENTVSMVIVTIYRCTSRANAECMRVHADHSRPLHG